VDNTRDYARVGLSHNRQWSNYNVSNGIRECCSPIYVYTTNNYSDSDPG